MIQPATGWSLIAAWIIAIELSMGGGWLIARLTERL